MLLNEQAVCHLRRRLEDRRMVYLSATSGLLPLIKDFPYTVSFSRSHVQLVEVPNERSTAEDREFITNN